MSQRESLQIKKYSNRRYYDTTRSCHVTLQDLYGLIRDGHDVAIKDSRTGHDITNVVLLQVILEKDQPKLDVFPAAILHQMIRSNLEVMRSSVERFFGPFMNVAAASQKQFEAYLRQAGGGKFVSPLDWASSMMSAFSPPAGEPSADQPDAEASPVPPKSDASVEDGGLNELRDQVAALTRRIEQLDADRNEPQE